LWNGATNICLTGKGMSMKPESILDSLTRGESAAIMAEIQRITAAIKTNEYGDFQSSEIPLIKATKRTCGVKIVRMRGWGGSKRYPRALKKTEYVTTPELNAAYAALAAAVKAAKKSAEYKAALAADREAAKALESRLRAERDARIEAEERRLADIGCSPKWLDALMSGPAGRLLREHRREFYDGNENWDAYDALTYAIKNNSSAWKAWQRDDICDFGELVSLCVGAHWRHTETDYDEIVTNLRSQGWSREEAREMAREEIRS